jgi:hypothetical protein
MAEELAEKTTEVMKCVKPAIEEIRKKNGSFS